MSPRLVGAVLAAVAAVLVVVSLLTSSLWAGHPSVDGREIGKKTVYVGMLGAEGCNTGGDAKCEDLVLADAFQTAGYAGVGVSVLLVLVLLVLAATAFANARSRKPLGKAAMVAALLGGGVAIALIAIGPTIKSSHTVVVPIGYGMFLFAGAVVAALLAGVLAPKDDPPMKLRTRAPAGLPAPQPATAGVDVLALLGPDSALHPTAPPPPLPGGMLPGPAGPLGPPANGMYGAPQLRPLYDAAPAQGGTHGFVPHAPAPPPPVPPAPIPRAQISAKVGIPTPPPMSVVDGRVVEARLDTQSDPIAPPPPPIAPPPAPAARAKAASVVPPPRTKAPSIPPPHKRPPPGFTSKGPTAIGPAVAPPAFAAAPTAPPPPFVATPGAAPPPFVAMPGGAPAIPAGSPMLPFRADTDPGDLAATRELSHEPDLLVGSPLSKPSAPKLDASNDSTDAVVKQPADEHTDVNAQPIDDGEEAATVAARSTRTADAGQEAPTRAVRSGTTPRPVLRAGSEAPTVAARSEPRPASEPPTIAARGSQRDLETSAPRPPRSAADDDEAATVARPKQEPEDLATDAEQARASSAKIPVSTADASLPPPKEEKAASAGPQPACPQCEAPMAWVEEHLRFYCKSCRMYF